MMTSLFFKSYSRRKEKKTAEGFTLLEILIAIFIFGVVVTTIFGSFNLIFSSTDAFDGGVAVYESARNCLHRMASDLQAVHVSLPPAFTPPGFNDPPDPYRFSGEIDTIGNTAFGGLRFASLAHIPFEKYRQQEGVAQIVYYVQPDDNGSFILRRSDTLFPEDPFRKKGTDPILCENLKSLKFTYYDDQGADSDRWDSDSDEFKYATPRAVGIQIELGRGFFSRQFAVMVALPAYRLKPE